MATTLEQIHGFLDEFDLHYRVDEERQAILIGFNLAPALTTYRDDQGLAHLGLVIRLMEDGEFLSVFAPRAWNVHGCQHSAAVFEALATIQGQIKMLRFDYDSADGEIRPNVEVPLEDSDLTSRQFHRAVHAVMQGIQQFDGVIRHARETGEVSFASPEQNDAGPPPDIVRLEELVAETGGLAEFERIACGCDIEESAAEKTTGAGPGSQAATAADGSAEPPPKAAIRWFWERLFGPSAQPRGARRGATFSRCDTAAE